MFRLSSFLALGMLTLTLPFACGDKQNPAGDFRGSGGGAGNDASGVSYARTIAPMMAASCAVEYCHDSQTRTAGIVLDTYEDVKANAESSNDAIQNQTMPVGPAPRLTDAERQAFDSWVKAGTPNN